MCNLNRIRVRVGLRCVEYLKLFDRVNRLSAPARAQEVEASKASPVKDPEQGRREGNRMGLVLRLRLLVLGLSRCFSLRFSVPRGTLRLSKGSGREIILSTSQRQVNPV